MAAQLSKGEEDMGLAINASEARGGAPGPRYCRLVARYFLILAATGAVMAVVNASVTDGVHSVLLFLVAGGLARRHRGYRVAGIVLCGFYLFAAVAGAAQAVHRSWSGEAAASTRIGGALTDLTLSGALGAYGVLAVLFGLPMLVLLCLRTHVTLESDGPKSEAAVPGHHGAEGTSGGYCNKARWTLRLGFVCLGVVGVASIASLVFLPVKFRPLFSGSTSASTLIGRNYVACSETANVLLVVACQFELLSSVDGEVGGPAMALKCRTVAGVKEIVLPRVRDCLLVVSPIGSLKRHGLHPSQARRLFLELGHDAQGSVLSRLRTAAQTLGFLDVVGFVDQLPSGSDDAPVGGGGSSGPRLIPE